MRGEGATNHTVEEGYSCYPTPSPTKPFPVVMGCWLPKLNQNTELVPRRIGLVCVCVCAHLPHLPISPNRKINSSVSKRVSTSMRTAELALPFRCPSVPNDARAAPVKPDSEEAGSCSAVQCSAVQCRACRACRAFAGMRLRHYTIYSRICELVPNTLRAAWPPPSFLTALCIACVRASTQTRTHIEVTALSI